MIQNKELDLSAFFGNQPAAEVFTNLFIKPTEANDFTLSINDLVLTDIINYPDAYNLMRADYYEKKEPGMSNNDIHWNFTDFIINTALFFNKIDPPEIEPRVTGENKDVANIITNVYMNWMNLSNETKRFYTKYMNLMKNQAGKWITVLEDDYRKITRDEYNLYRVNFIKINLRKNKEHILFINLLPKFTRDNHIFNDIWYTNEYNVHTKIDTSKWNDPGKRAFTINFFKNLFNNVYHLYESVQLESEDFISSGEHIAIEYYSIEFNPNFIFKFNVDQYIRKRLFAIQQELKKPTSVKGPVLSFTDKNIWKVDETGRLYRDETSGRVYYGDGDPGSIKDLGKNFKCYSTFANVTGDNCEKYVSQCLLDNDENSLKICAEMWKRKDFYTVSVNEIKNMHPLIAVKTLEKFGFRVHVVEDIVAGMPVKKFESVDHWIKHVLDKTWGQRKIEDTTGATGATGTTEVTLQSIIENNENILNYLRLLVEYVNANPVILNGKEFARKTSEALGKHERTELAIKLNIPMIKEPKREAKTYYDYSMLKSYMNMRLPQTPSLIGIQAKPTITQHGSLYGLNMPYQIGGRINLNKTSGVASLLGLIMSTVEDLKTMGKTIAQNDLDNIIKKAETMMMLEQELVKTLVYLENYKYYMELFKDYGSKMLTMDALEKIVEKYKDLLSKQTTEEGTLLKILGSLQGLKMGKCTEDFINDDCLYEKPSLDINLSHEEDCIPKQKICK